MINVSPSAAAPTTRLPAEKAPARNFEPRPAGAKPAGGADECATGDGRCGAPRHSPLFRAVIEALDTVLGSAAAKAATAAPATATADKAGAAGNLTAEDAPVELEQAVAGFARALLQVMRGTPAGEVKDGGRGPRVHDHPAHHHDRHRDMVWGGPAQHVEQLGAKLGAATPASVAAATAPAPPDMLSASAPTQEPPLALPVNDDAHAARPDRALVPTAMIHVKYSIEELSPWGAAAERAEQSLLNAYGTLRKAMGVEDTPDRPTLREQLSHFLQTLADKLRLGEDAGFDSTQPGALLDTTA